MVDRRQSTAHLLDAQTEIMRRLASALNVALVAAEVTRASHERPDDPDALDLFFRARSVIDRAGPLADFTTAQNLLERAIKAQPDFVDALYTLGWLLVRKEQSFEYPTTAEDDREAERVIAHALTLAPDNPAVLAARGRFLAADGKCAEARASFDTALAGDPNNVLALTGVALCAWRIGEPDKVGPALQTTLRIDPQGAAVNRRYLLLGLAALFDGHSEEAIRLLLRADAQEGDQPADVDNPTAPESTRLFLVAAYALAGDLDEARRRYAAFRLRWPHRTIWRDKTFLTPAQTGVPAFSKIEDALAAAGMPRFADEHEDDKVAPSPSPLKGGRFTPTPRTVPGGETVDTGQVRRLLAGRPAPVVVDVGNRLAVIPGALLLSDDEAAYRRAAGARRASW